MWVSPHLIKFLWGQVASFLGFLTWDPSVIWNTIVEQNETKQWMQIHPKQLENDEETIAQPFPQKL